MLISRRVRRFYKSVGMAAQFSNQRSVAETSELGRNRLNETRVTDEKRSMRIAAAWRTAG